MTAATFIWNGNDSSGVYVAFVQTIAGCDINFMDLTIHYSTDLSDSAVSCNFTNGMATFYFTVLGPIMTPCKL